MASRSTPSSAPVKHGSTLRCSSCPKVKRYALPLERYSSSLPACLFGAASDEGREMIPTPVFRRPKYERPVPQAGPLYFSSESGGYCFSDLWTPARENFQDYRSKSSLCHCQFLCRPV